jgi:hypothetical protein
MIGPSIEPHLRVNAFDDAILTVVEDESTKAPGALCEECLLAKSEAQAHRSLQVDIGAEDLVPVV